MTQRRQRWQLRLTDFTRAVGHISAWFALALVGIMVLVVVLRYGFDIGNTALQESLLYFHGALLTLGMAYTLAEDGHVRVDVFYRRFKPRTRAWVNLLGTLLLLLPVCGVIFWLSLDYVLSSWREGETSANGGLPFVYLLKTLLLVLPLLLTVQAVAELLRYSLILTGDNGSPEIHDGKDSW